MIIFIRTKEMAKNPGYTQDKIDLIAQIPEEIIELISSGVKTQTDLQSMIMAPLQICNKFL
jgi:hypothetical protein